MTHGHFLQMGGFALHRSSERGGDFICVLFPDVLGNLSSKNRITFPMITSDEIKDRSKGDSLSKSIALGQTLWFLAQCVSRPAQGLVTTELELVTLAFAALNGFMYFFWWYKPLDIAVQVPVYLCNAKDDPEFDEYIAEVEGKKQQKSSHKLTFTSILEIVFIGPISRFRDMSDITTSSRGAVIISGATSVPTYHAYGMSILRTSKAIISASLIGIFFGAIHVAGWNFAFQTTAERLCWRIASLIMLGVPALMIPVEALSAAEWKSRKVAAVLDIIRVLPAALLVYLGVPAYIIARIAILVLALMGLRNLPDSALKSVDWSSFLPHI
ncbi:hypothetical protein D9619_002375 [Psilocybe cf. subviscida]|uniref:Uncharacterized protein n=1 Tax=Psilocybe cf. subviscida TaxID=2480587 RepID=A0A8H5EUQ3_9AGAR|nr:hypothetical protein D9619_002375 [Psilocybe cf. subviscida]